MIIPASLSGGDYLRLFCALRLPEDVVAAIAGWQVERLSGGRTVPRENLHVTLAFLGSRPRNELPTILDTLRTVAASAGPLGLEPVHYGETRTAGIVVLADEGGHAGAVARELQERLGVSEARPWLPHVTVLRFRTAPRLRLEPPRIGRFTPSDAAAFLSRPSPSGAQYEVLESVALGG
ncbi:MAG: RNA 2',3'-cyclic phosphodiesterase [Gaiellaceae bacterium]